MVEWVRYYFGEDDAESFHELDGKGWTLRQVDLPGPDRRPVTAATLAEVLHIRDTHDLASMQAYERRFGVLASGSLAGWREIDDIVEINAAEFEQVWAAARRAMDQSPGGRGAAEL